ncbi:enoyl-CoA hydratase/isomerase [Xylariales sp. AK1849]|nr:enoyl-CoA hydratase/isomerase [Xylariales sp. AK1849]
MAAKTLFTVPIQPLNAHIGGNIVCTEPSPQVYLLTFTSPPDNRLTPTFCSALLTALDLIESKHPTGAVVTTSSITKFYSNGLDLELAMKTPGFTENSLYPVFRRFLTFPMPTIALINGHAFAGGFMLAMHHDYRVFSGNRGYLCINELEFGAPLLPPMSGIFRVKCRADVYRTTALEAKRWDATSALDSGILDRTDGMDGVLALVKDKGLTTKGKTGIYGILKAEMYREQVALLDARGKDVVNFDDLMGPEKKRKQELKARVAQAKL